MALKLLFEIGHSAARKTKPSKEGFTHDWELFVRGPNDAHEIQLFVEKVAFNLHESFPKPKRVIKDPPYTVKEAGYAGFVLTIDIYLKNRDEPKKVTFEYDLDLQPFKIQTNEVIVPNPSEDFKKKCLKGGATLISSNDYKNRESYGKSSQMPSMNEMKKLSKRPEEAKPNKTFTDLFGAPLKKVDPRTQMNSSPNPAKLQAMSSAKGGEKNQSMSKDKSDKSSKHKHSPSKDNKKTADSTKTESDKPKKDKTKDRDRAEKKEKAMKRPPSSSPNPPSTFSSSSSSLAKNSTNSNALPVSKSDMNKPKQSSTPTPSADSSLTKKNVKKDKKSHEKGRERSEKKEFRAKENSSSKEKSQFEQGKGSGSSGAGGGGKDRDLNVTKDDREKSKLKFSSSAGMEPKPTLNETVKKPHDKDSERKHKHKKKEKTKDKDASRDSKKDKTRKNAMFTSSPAKTKDQNTKFDASDSDIDSPPSIKQDSDNSLLDSVVQKPVESEKSAKKPREKPKASDREEKNRKKRSSKKDENDFSASPPPAKVPRKEVSKSPMTHDRPSSSDSINNQSLINNNNIESSINDRKISNEYMSELKDLKQKITTLKNNDELQQVVRMIAATGCYEITKSSFDFDLVQLDRGTVQRLQDFFAAS